MSFSWFKRLFSRWSGTAHTVEVETESALAVEDAPAEAPVYAAEQAVTTPRDPDPRPLPHSDPRQPVMTEPPAHIASSASLGRSLAWRVRVLLDGAGDEVRKSDGPALVEALLECGDTVIRQPPAAAQKALEVSRNPRSSTDEIVTLFESDPSLTQSLLTMANSAYYSRGDEPLVSIHDAVRRVGLRVVESLLMESMVQGLLCRPGGPFDSMMRMTWSHMQRTAPLARAIAPEWGVHPDTAYSLALLHDVGKLVIFDHVSTLRREERRDLRIPDRFFRDLIGHLHEPVGGLAMLRWGMGGEAAYAIGEHHRRPVPETPSALTEVLFVAEAVELAHANHARLDWQELWTRGGINVDAVAVEQRVADQADGTAAL
jgi:HD-like signal output (HDOD) protein